MNIPCYNPCNLFGKMLGKEIAGRYILTNGLHLFNVKMRLRPKRGIAFLPRPDSYRGWVRSGDFYRAGSEVFQIVKKFVFIILKF